MTKDSISEETNSIAVSSLDVHVPLIELPAPDPFLREASLRPRRWLQWVRPWLLVETAVASGGRVPHPCPPMSREHPASAPLFLEGLELPPEAAHPGLACSWGPEL